MKGTDYKRLAPKSLVIRALIISELFLSLPNIHYLSANSNDVQD